MGLLSMLHLLILIIAAVGFLILIRQLGAAGVKGIGFVIAGFGLIYINIIIGSLFHGKYMPEDWVERWFEQVGFVTGYIGQTAGLILLLAGTYIAIRSILPHLSEHYSSLVERSLVGVYIIQDGIIKFANPRMSEITGYSRQEIAGMKLLDVIAPESRALVARNLRKRLEGEEKSIQYELKALKKNGEKFDVEVYGSRTTYLGKPAVHGTLLDITDRRRAERIQKAHIYHMESLNSISEAIQHGTDLEETLQEVTRRLLSIFDCDRAWLLYPCDPNTESYKIPYESTKPEYPGGFALGKDIPMEPEGAKIAKEALSTDGHVSYGPTKPMPENAGFAKRFEVRSQMIIALNPKMGKPWMMGLHQCSYEREWSEDEQRLFHDISHRVTDALDKMLLYRDLHSSEEQYRTLVENAEDAIYILQDNKFNVVNPAFEKMLGYTADETVAEDFNFMDLVAPESRELIIQRAAARERGEDIPSCYEFRGISKNGEAFDFEASTQAIVFRSKPAVQGILRDVTEKKRAERERTELREKLEQAQRMESLGVLAGGVAHDLNNVLGPIMAYPDLILSELPADSPVGIYVNQIKAAAERAAGIVGDLLSLTRRGKYEMKPVNLNDFVVSYVSSADFMKIKAKHQSVLFESNLAPELMNISGSESHLLKVLMNLVINGFESMPHGGVLKINTLNAKVETRLLGFEEIGKGNYVLLEVEDSGFGIDNKDLPNIFEPFYTKKKTGLSGTGLGLTVVYGVVKDHKGYIDVTTKVGVGTKFSVYFPVTTKKKDSIEDMYSDYRGDETILVVDDMNEQRDLAVNTLSTLGYKVYTVGNGHDAIEFVKEKEADLVILDMILEENFDGLDTYREILKTRVDQKAIIVSGFSETDRVQEAKKIGVGIYIRKPYTIEKIGKAVREELDRK